MTILAHSRSICALEWRLRNDDEKLGNLIQPQTLATLARDSCIRIWQETDPYSEKLDVVLVSIIPASSLCSFRGICWVQFAASFEGSQCSSSSKFPTTLDEQERRTSSRFSGGNRLNS